MAGPSLTPSSRIILAMLSEREAEEIRAGLAKGMGGPLLVKWANQLLKDRDDRRRARPTNGNRPRWENVVVGIAGRKEPQELTQRLRVPNGWLYRTIVRGVGERQQYGVALCFVPEQR